MKAYFVVLTLAVAVYWFKDPVIDYFASSNGAQSGGQLTEEARRSHFLLKNFLVNDRAAAKCSKSF